MWADGWLRSQRELGSRIGAADCRGELAEWSLRQWETCSQNREVPRKIKRSSPRSLGGRPQDESLRTGSGVHVSDTAFKSRLGLRRCAGGDGAGDSRGHHGLAGEDWELGRGTVTGGEREENPHTQV